MRTRLVLLLILLSFAGLPATARAVDPPAALSDKQQAVLGQLDPALAKECLEAARDAETWLRELEAIKKETAAIRDAAVDFSAAPGPDRAEAVIKMAEALMKRSVQFRKLVGLNEGFEKRVKALDAKVKGLRIDPRDLVDVNEKDLHKLLVGALRAEAAGAILADLPKALEAIRLVKDPARYAQDFLENEVKKKFLAKPYDFDGARLTVTQQDFRRSLFSPEANIAVTLEYPALDLKLKASGLYFRYRPGALPEPVLDKDKFKVDASPVDALVNKTLKSLGTELPDVGLPISIKDPQFTGFSAADARERGSIGFTVVLGFGGLFDVKPVDVLKARTKVVVYLNGDVKVGEEIRADIDTPIVLPGTGLQIDGGFVKYKPKDKEKAVTIGTFLTPVGAGKESVSLDITMSFGFPVTAKGIFFDGKMLFARSVLIGTVEGHIAKDRVKGRLTMPGEGSPVPKAVFEAEHQFELNREGFAAKGASSIFRLHRTQMELMLKFNGYGSLTAKEELKLPIPGVSVTGTLDIDFTPGFRKVTLLADFTAAVDLRFRKVNASISVDASSVRDPRVIVTAKAFGVTAKLEMDDLSELTPDKLFEAFKPNLGDLIDNMADALADLEKVSGAALAKAEEQLRNEVSAAFKRAGMDKLDTGNPTLNARLKDLSDGGKNVIDWSVKTRQKMGKFLTDFRQSPAKTLQGSIASIGNDLSNLEGDIRAAVIPGEAERLRRKKRDKEAERNRLEQQLREMQEREKVAEKRLAALVRALNGPAAVLDRRPASARPGQRPEKVTSLHIACENAACSLRDPSGQGKDAVVVFLFHADGYRVHSRSRASDSDVKSASVRFTGLEDPSGRVTAKIDIPQFRHGSDLPAWQMFRDLIADLVEKYVPGAVIDGRYYE